ncbi:MAG: extracellular solute-binding protein [Verrucomicrobia bacterium]|nr:extracellular solute-binding protein [Verrucomicrobiota bacterium]
MRTGKKHRPLWIHVLLLAALSALLPADELMAGWIEDLPDRTVLHVKVHDWIFPDPSRTDTPTRADAAAAREFIRRFPETFAAKYREKYQTHPEMYGEHNWDHVEVRLHMFSGIQVEGVESDLLAIAGRVAPDVIYVNFRRSDTYIQQGFLYPLDKPEDNYLPSFDEEESSFRIHPKIWPVISRKGPDGQKRVWALPYGGALGKVLLYRKDLFDEAGVDYPNEQWTWDDLHAACRKLTDPANGIYAIRFGRGKHESWYWTTFLWSMGADVLEYDEDANRWDVVFDTPAAAEALDYYTMLCTEPWTDAEGKRRYGYAYKDPSEAYVKWERGEIAMAMGYIDEKVFATINPDVTGMAPVPIGPTGLRGGELNSRMMGLFSEIEDPAVRDAAWEFVRFYDSKDAVEIKTRIMVEGGLGPFVNPRYLRMFGYSELIRLAPKGWEDTFRIAIETGRPEPYGKHSNIAYDIMTEPIQQAEQMALAGKLPQDREERLTLLHGLLKTAGDKARREMLGEIPHIEMQKRRATAAAFLIAVVAVFTWVFRRIITAFTPTSTTQVKNKGLQIGRYRWAYILLIPALLTIFVWQYIPLLRGSIMAFQDYRIMGGSSWIWLDNFGNVLWDADWWSAVWNAIRYSMLVVALTFLPPVVLAILLQEVPQGKIVFRTLFYLPAVITGLVVILLWKSFYDPSERGALNAVIMKIPAIGFLLLGAVFFLVAAAFARRLWQHEMRLPSGAFFGVAVILFGTCYSLAHPIFTQPGVSLIHALFMTLPEPYRWLNDPSTSMIACVMPMVWAGMGPGCLIYLAALKGIADDFYEAADIDGATFVDKILFIVFPILKPLLIINFVGVFIGSWFGATANILAMTGGAANTEVAGLHIFYKAFIYLQFGPATAMAWVLGFLLIGFTVYQLRILSRLEFKTTEEK